MYWLVEAKSAAMEKCEHCGVKEHDKVGQDTISLRPCVCMEMAFCSEACLKANKHYDLCYSIDRPKFRRILRMGNHPAILLAYVNTIVEIARSFQQFQTWSEEAGRRLQRELINRFKKEVGSKDQEPLENALEDFNRAILKKIQEPSYNAERQMSIASRTMVRIWKSANRIALQWTSVEIAWRTFQTAILKFLNDVELGGTTPFDEENVLADIADLRRLADAVGRVLNGGRWAETEGST